MSKMPGVLSKLSDRLNQPGGIFQKIKAFFSKFKQSKFAQKFSLVFDRTPKAIRWGLLAVLILAVAFGGYSIFKNNSGTASTESGGELQTTVVRTGSIILSASGTGTLVPVTERSIGFDTSGEVIEVLVSAGDEVEEGTLLARLDDTEQQRKLEEAEQTLREMTSAASIAIAQQDVVNAEDNLYDAQVAVNTLTYWYDEAVIANAQATYVLALAQLEKAQDAYDKVANESETDSGRAQAYKTLYAAQQAVDTASYYVNIYSSKPNQRRIDEANANLALAEAQLQEAKYYLAALQGEEVPEDATGSSLENLRQAQQNVEDAKADLEATNLYAPFAGTIMSVDISAGDTVGTGSVITIADLSQANIEFYMDSEDWTNTKVGYEVEATFDALPDQVFTGIVTEVEPGLVSVSGLSMVKGMIELDQSFDEIQIPSGVSVAVEIISGQAKNVLVVPVEALHQLSDGSYVVFVMESGSPKMQIVEVGLTDGTYAEIISGLQQGDVVTTGVVETQE